MKPARLSKANYSLKQVRVSNRGEWRRWLARNHAKEPKGIWLVFSKTGQASLSYEESVQEALCYGWIDSVVKRIDEDWYCRKFTPRRAGSVWSKLNRARATRAIETSRMTRFGLAKIQAAKRSGTWEQTRPALAMKLPKEFVLALAQNTKARETFDRLAPTYQKHFAGWIVTAKRAETQAQRVKESIALLAQGQKLGLK